MSTSLEMLVHDEILHALFKSAGTNCAVQLWLLQIKEAENIETRLLYGRVLPYNFSNNKWSAPTEDSFKSFSDYQAQVIRINLYCEASKIIDLVSSLSCGKNISCISNDLKLGMSPVLQSRFGKFCFTGKLCYRPVSYLPMRDDFDSNGLKSPHGSAGAFSGALTPFNKGEIFIYNGKIDQDALSYAIAEIDNDTGMSFAKEDTERLGDLELLVFPTLDSHERNLFRTEWKEKGKIINVSLEQVEVNRYDTFHIKTSFTNDHKIVYSVLKTVHVLNDTVSADFDLPEYLNNIIDGLYVEIHAKKSNDNSAVLYCQYGVGFIREIGFTLHNVSASVTGTVKSDWLTKVTKMPKNSARIIAAQSINQGMASSYSVVGGRQADPWVSINRNAKAQLEKFQPTPSEGRFFKRYKDGDGSGRLEFQVWIKNILNSHQKHQIIIFDPYFEDAGITLLVPNASTDNDCIVFTTSESPKSSDPQRLNNIERCCEQLSVLVKRIRLRIFALPKDSFHDRYILISEKSGEPLKGFHLSNSIQKANENFPLLITPIPPDVLIKVNNYALEILDENLKTDVAPFFDSKAPHDINEARRRYEPLLFLDEKEAGTVLATWTGVQDLKNLRSQPLKTKLEQLGFLQGESLNGDKFVNCANIFSFLGQIDGVTFNQYWDITGNILANTPSGDLLDSYEISDVDALCNALLIFLKGKITEEYLDDFDAQDAFSFYQRLNDSMDKVMNYRGVWEFYHGMKFNAISWADFYAIKILWYKNPNLLLDFIEEANKSILGDDTYNREKIKIYSILAQTISEIALNVEFNLTVDQIAILINRNNNFIKWLGYCALESAIAKNDNALATVNSMHKSEKIIVMGWIINRIPIKDVDKNPLFSRLVDEYILYFPSVLVKEDVTLCINSLWGSIRRLGWCEPWLFNQVVEPLIKKNSVSFDDLAVIWMNEMDELFNGILNGHSVSFSFSNISNEGRTTDITAYLVAKSSVEYQKNALSSLNKIIKKLKQDIQKPLSSTTNWHRWDASLKTAFWIYGLLKWIDYHLPVDSSIKQELDTSLNDAYKLSMHRSISEWESLNYAGGEYSIFLKNRSDLG